MALLYGVVIMRPYKGGIHVKKTVIAFTVASTIGVAGVGKASAEVHEVQNGETLWSISNEYNVTVDEIKEWNDLTSTTIYPNQVLRVDGDYEYTIQQGDTLTEIAKQYRVTVEQLKEWNQIEDEHLIYVGDTLVMKEVGEQKETAEETTKAVKSLTVTATAYTANCEGCSGTTATGINLHENPDKKIISVDPSVIPLGTKVYVEGYGEAVAADTGGAIKGNKIDVFFPSEETAKQWGVKTVKIQLLDE